MGTLDVSNVILPSDPLAAVYQALVDRILLDVPRAVAVYAYGSRVRGGVHPKSDLDLALLLPHRQTIPPEVLLQLQGDLEAIAGVPAEISILRPETQLVHCKEVVAHGVPIYVADKNALAVFEMQTLSSYARFMQDRKPVIAAYVEERKHG
jgi:predicted nucleotidyltransferase